MASPRPLIEEEARAGFDFPFTTGDSPALRARIEGHLRTALAAVTSADRFARSIVLTGGFSRGEGSAVGDVPLNDYDLVVFRALPGGARIYRRVKGALEARLGLHVDLLPVWTRRVPVLARKVFWYDLRHGGRVLWGDARIVPRVPVHDAETILPSEAPRLLANRAVGLLEACPGPGKDPDPERVLFQSAKAVLACAEARLILAGEYRPTLRARFARYRELAGEGTLPSALLPHLRWASAFKLSPGDAPPVDPLETWEWARAHLLATAADALPRAGWGPFARYPDAAPLSFTEALHAFLARRGRPGSLREAARVRALGFALLEAATFPSGATPTPRVKEAFHALRVDAPSDWTAMLDRLQRARARTLQ